MQFDKKLIHYVGRLACRGANIFQPTVDPLLPANDVFDAAASQVTDHLELESIDIDSIILASHGLDPALPWKEYGLFGDDNKEHRNDIPIYLLQKMEAQIHR